jgi:hypothetical protein
MHFGSKNNHFPYSIGQTVLGDVDLHKDLGVNFDPKLKFSVHCSQIAVRAHRLANLILKCFLSRIPEVLWRAFSTFVRPVLEYASEVWCPFTKSSINVIESVQRKFTKRLAGFHGLSYHERLSRLGVESLELRRVRADLRLCFKLVNGLSYEGPPPILTLSARSANLRCHSKQLIWPTSKKNNRYHFFQARVGRV